VAMCTIKYVLAKLPVNIRYIFPKYLWPHTNSEHTLRHAGLVTVSESLTAIWYCWWLYFMAIEVPWRPVQISTLKISSGSQRVFH